MVGKWAGPFTFFLKKKSKRMYLIKGMFDLIFGRITFKKRSFKRIIFIWFEYVESKFKIILFV